jgi:hypothetical protein
MMTLVGDGSGYFVDAQHNGVHKNLDFGMIYQTPHLGPQNTCMIKVIVQKQPLVERRGNVTGTVAIFTNKTKPQNVDVSFEDDWLQIVISNHGHIDQVSNFLDQPSPASGDNTGVGVYLINKLVTRTLGGQIELLHNYNQQVRIALKIPQFKTSTF